MSLDFFNDPLAMARMSTQLEVGGNVYGAMSHLIYAHQLKQAGAYQAEQLRINAGQAQAASQVDAEDVQRRTDLLTSRALAVAAASGGGASDPTVVNLMSGIAAEGAYRKAVALYRGDEEARSLEQRAEATEYDAASRASSERRTAFGGFIGAGASLAKSMAKEGSLRQKYGGAGPKLDFNDKNQPADGWGPY